MKRVLVLNGSPKAVSDTMVLTRAFLQGLNGEGAYEIDVVDVIKKQIKPCLGCFKCWQNGDGKCIQQDDQNAILEQYAAADLIIYSFPLYCYAMPSHLKAVLDRTIPLMQIKMVEVDGIVQHVPLVDFSGKRTIVISGCGFPDWEDNYNGLRIMCNNSFGHPTMVFVSEAPLLNAPEADAVTGPLVEAFIQAGIEYREKDCLSEVTVNRLETPMIPKEAYMEMINGIT